MLLEIAIVTTDTHSGSEIGMFSRDTLRERNHFIALYSRQNCVTMCQKFDKSYRDKG